MYKSLKSDDVKSKLREVIIDPDVSFLSDNQNKVLKYLFKAADVIRDLYLFQKNSIIPDIITKLKSSDNNELVELIYIFNDIYNQFDGSCFVEGEEFDKERKSFYPDDLTLDEWEDFVKENPECKDDFISPYTVIVREDGRLKAVPYSEYYKEYLVKASKLLSKASEYADNFFLKSYLHAQANAFISNDYNEANIRWLQLTDNRIEPLIGAYEFYDDKFLGCKYSFTALIGVNNFDEHKRLKALVAASSDIQAILPVPVNYKKSNNEKKSTILIVDLLYSSGDGSGPIHTAAFNLPNSQKIRAEFGSKKVFLRNVIEAKFNVVMGDIAGILLNENDKAKVSFNAYFNHILLHEISHSLGIGLIKDENGVFNEVSYYLKELYPVIEEAKSDVMGLFSQIYLLKQCIIIDTTFIESAFTYVVSLIRSIRFGSENAHGVSSVVQWNFLLKDGAIIINSETLKLSINLHKIEKSIEKLLTVLLTLQGEGNYEKSQEFINEYSFVDTILKKILEIADECPIDILPVFNYNN